MLLRSRTAADEALTAVTAALLIGATMLIVLPSELGVRSSPTL